MRTFVLVMFWMFVFGMVQNVFLVTVFEKDRWAKVAAILFQMPFMLWAGYLLWA